MKQIFDCSSLAWVVAGSMPDVWRFTPPRRIGERHDLEVEPVPVRVPGSVQGALRDAGVVPDWNVALNSWLSEWVENRDWIFETSLPDDWFQSGLTYRLNCLGLDYCGEVLLNGKKVGTFKNAFMPQLFDLTPHLAEQGNILQIAFTPPPRALGQFGWTCFITDWKPRFNYIWDWTSRLVQAGIWDSVFIEASDGRQIEQLRCVGDANLSDKTGTLRVVGSAEGGAGARVRLTLEGPAGTIRAEELDAEQFSSEGLFWEALPVELWWPNGLGAQPLYTLRCQLLDGDGNALDEQTRRVGFKHVDWEKCLGGPPEADPWICVVNGRRLFLQGVNWTPIRPNFADVADADYRLRLELYRDLNMNMMRVWGGAFLEKECFYDLCDELGLMIWQEFPLSSSGSDCWPPDTEPAMTELCAIARSYIWRRQHHAALTLWCGGNELSTDEEGGHSVFGGVRPADLRHPLLARFKEIADEMDPTRRYLATSPTGPTSCPDEKQVGTGVSWDVHGPWRAGELDKWEDFFRRDDSLFRSEIGACSASSVEIIRRTKGMLPEMPPSASNPLWRRQAWWIEDEDFKRENGREPQTLEEYVAWSQQRQAKALSIVAECCKGRFPRCGGMLVWMGHDSFPCTANTSIVDFDGKPKPAALALGEIFRRPVE